MTVDPNFAVGHDAIELDEDAPAGRERW